jgi:hypothetical protein
MEKISDVPHLVVIMSLRVSLHLCGHGMLPGEEVSLTKTTNIKQYLSTNHFLVNNRHCVIKYSQTQLYITKVFEKNSVVY